MRILNLYTVCLFLLIGIFNGLESSAILIRVSTLTGNDNSSCLLSNATTPCKTVTFALNAPKDSRNRNETDFTFIIKDHVYYLEKRINITQTSPDKSIILKSSHSTGSIIYCVNISAGIEIGSRATEIDKTRNINFVNLQFENCGPRFAAAVIIWNSVDINFTNCVFKHNRQAGINAFDSAVTIDSCLFLNNTSNGNNTDEEFKEGLTSAGGGAAFVFRDAEALSVSITNSNFTLNSAVTNDTKNFIDLPSSTSGFNSIGGGGLYVAFQKKTTYCQAVIKDNIFLNNSATFGGGVGFANYEMALHNSLSITNSSFLGNTAGEAGGGLIFAQWDNASMSTAIFKNCTVSENMSRRGAGIVVFLMSYDETPNDSVFQFDTVVFSKNLGNAIVAIRLTTALPYGHMLDVTPEFINCTIEDHNMSPFLPTTPFVSQRVNVIFKGHNVFRRNHGGGAAEFQDSVLNVHGQLVFANNIGFNGGAMYLMSSQIILHPGSELKFLRNLALGLGGAMFVVQQTRNDIIQVNNPDCFLAYSDPHLPPSKWKANISFKGNGCLSQGAAIYVTFLVRCAWTEDFPHYDPQKALRWSSNFVYQYNWLLHDRRFLIGSEYDIATDSKRFHSKDNSTVKIAPGQNFPLSLQGVDEIGHNVYTTAFAFEANNSKSRLLLQNNLYILSPNSSSTVPFSFRVPETLYNETYSRRDKDMRKILFVNAFTTFQNVYSFEFELQVCRPGFHYSSESMTCQCNKKQDGVMRCGQDKRTVYLKEGYWGGEVNGRLVTYFCPPNYCRCVHEGDLPGCIFNPDRIDDQCVHNRTGVLCGQCQKGLSVGLRPEECVDCDGGAWIIAIFVIIVVIVCVVIIILNPCMSSELRGPLFFFQVLPFVFKPNNDVGRRVLFVGNLLNFSSPYFLHTCIIKGMTNLYAVAFGYLMPFVILLVFLVCYILSKKFYLVRFKLRKNSSLQSFWLMTLFAYNNLAVTTFMLLYCPRVGENNVFFYDGNMECFKGEHLVMAVVAIVFLCGLVIPLPVVVLLLTKGCCRVDPQYVSTLINGLRPHCLWWWSVDLLRRVLLMATYSFISNWNTKQVVMSLMCALILAVHSIFQPYTQIRVNVVESLYLFILCITATVQFLQESDSITNIVCSVLFIATALHTVALTVYKAVGFFKRRFKCPKRCTERRTYGSVSETSIDRSVDEEQRTREDIFNTMFTESEESKSFSYYSE